MRRREDQRKKRLLVYPYLMIVSVVNNEDGVIAILFVQGLVASKSRNRVHAVWTRVEFFLFPLS